MKNTLKKGLGVAIVSVAAMGMSGQALADVYGAGRLIIEDLTIGFNATSFEIGGWTFNTGATASLNGNSGPGYNDSCTGTGFDATGGTCDNGQGAGVVLSGPAVNAPLGDVNRLDDTFNLFGTGVGDYSNADSAIIDAQLVEDANTDASVVAESNIAAGTVAGASSNVSSNTALEFTFELQEGGTFDIAFDAIWDAIAEINGASTGATAFGQTAASLTLQSNNGTFIFWAPGLATVCNGATSCVAVEAGSLNNTATTSETGSAIGNSSGSGAFGLTINGLASGTYTLGLAASTQTIVSQNVVPAPATLLLMGAGLLAGAGVSRRKKAA